MKPHLFKIFFQNVFYAINCLLSAKNCFFSAKGVPCPFFCDTKVASLQTGYNERRRTVADAPSQLL